MKDVYVERTIFGTYEALSKEDAIQKANDGHHASIAIGNWR